VDERIALALLLSAFAGLSTTVGSLLGLFVRDPGPRFVTLTLGFAAGVMVLISFVELLPSGIETVGFGPALLAFFGGMVAMFLIDVLIPHEYAGEQQRVGDEAQNGQLLKAGMFVALGLAIHNFPEGMATFAATLEDVSVGVAIAVAIAIHNIPEGLAVSAPVYAATGSRGKAFLWSFLSGVSEPLGALLAALILLPFLNEAVLGYVLSVVAGIMIFIAIDELIPVSRSFDNEHLSIVGIIAGMMVTAISLWLLGRTMM
jgi:ZIP family zinc transporter